MTTVEYTPLIKQYFSIVDQYPGTIVLMRVGDFYETYGEIAVTTSKILGITLTKRSIGSSITSHDLELSGFPYRSIDSYLPKLIQVGYKVAVCDQLEDASQAKGLVKRGVTEFITPGLVTQESLLENKNNNYLASVFWRNDDYGIAFLDYSTGEFITTQGNLVYIQKLIDNFSPNELIYSKDQEEHIKGIIYKKNKTSLPDWVFKDSYAIDIITKHFDSSNIKGFGLEDMPTAVVASGAILQYLTDTGHQNISHITSLSRIEPEKYVWLDKFTVRNLELINSQHENGSTLLEVIDNTITSMGGRMLKRWIMFPLKNVEDITKRQGYVSTFYNDADSEKNISDNLNGVTDLERIVSKISVRKAIPKDLLSIVSTFERIKAIKNVLYQMSIKDLVLYDCQEMVDSISRHICDNPTQGNFIREGIDKELDDYKKVKINGQNYLDDLLFKEIRNTGITSLRLSYNKIYGYYFEVTNANKDKVPYSWRRKQTLVGAERYVSDELKVFEDKILNADSKISEIENRIFNELIDEVTKYSRYMLHNANVIAQLDCYISFSTVAKKNKYVRPYVTNEDGIVIEGGRHPVIEAKLEEPNFFVPNNINLNNDDIQIMLITGPNMSGKSALLRQIALIVLMAQIGSYVPADKAEVGIVDKIFTRIGASDNISTGESTFMMEMTETASILHNLSRKSLVLMDEIGRGTSTYDGISIAWSIIEYLHDSPYRPKTLFATHYHELSKLEDKLNRLRNFHLSVKEIDKRIVYVRELESGGSEHSFGINVAKMSGMPSLIVRRAKQILKQLETSNGSHIVDSVSDDTSDSQTDMNYEMERLINFIQSIDVDKVTPLEALVHLNTLKKQTQHFKD